MRSRAVNERARIKMPTSGGYSGLSQCVNSGLAGIAREIRAGRCSLSTQRCVQLLKHIRGILADLDAGRFNALDLWNLSNPFCLGDTIAEIRETLQDASRELEWRIIRADRGAKW
jgi:hypothetical protein